MNPIYPPGGDNGQNEISTDGIASLLAMARQRIDEGNPSLALQAVVVALRASGGERAVLQALGRAREMYHNERQANQDVSQLSALFAECGLAEMVSSNGNQVVHPTGVSPAVPTGVQEMEMMDTNASRAHTSAPILAESGRLQVVMDASSDGSSFVCARCGGVVSNLRRDEHFQFWCSQSHG